MSVLQRIGHQSNVRLIYIILWTSTQITEHRNVHLVFEWSLPPSDPLYFVGKGTLQDKEKKPGHQPNHTAIDLVFPARKIRRGNCGAELVGVNN